MYYLDPDDEIVNIDYIFKPLRRGFPEKELCFPVSLLDQLPVKYKSSSKKRFCLNQKGKNLAFQLKVIDWRRSELSKRQDEIEAKLDDHK